MAVNSTHFPARGARSRSATGRSASTPRPQHHLSDDEILGLVTTVARPSAAGNSAESNAPTNMGTDNSVSGSAARAFAPYSADANTNDADNDSDAPDHSAAADNSPAGDSIPAALANVLDANPQLRQAFDDAQAYRSVFASPAAARDAKNQLDELDEMFFSAQPHGHAALAARIHDLSPGGFHGLARAMHAHAAKVAASAQPSETPDRADAANALENPAPGDFSPAPARAAHAHASPRPPEMPASSDDPSAAPAHLSSAPPRHSAFASADPRRAAQAAFFHDTNAAAVEQVLGAIHSQVNRLLPESVPSSARNRIIGEIYRELDSTMRANRQLGKQLREAFQAGAGDAAHQRAIVTLVAGRARQALPSVAKRVIGEWTQSIIGANHDRLSRHESASKRVDIAGAGSSDGVNRKPVSPRDLDYRRLSDADILNL